MSHPVLVVLASLALAMTALATGPAAAEPLPALDTVLEATEKIRFEGLAKRKRKVSLRLLTGRTTTFGVARLQTEFVLGEAVESVPWSSEPLIWKTGVFSWTAGTARAVGNSGRKFAIAPGGLHPMHGEVNRALDGENPRLVGDYEHARAEYHETAENLLALRESIDQKQAAVDELKSRRFWWIFHGDTVYALESLIDDRKDELSGESSAHDEALREMLDLFPRVWPYQAVRRDGELLLKFNKKGTRVRVKGTLAIEARDGSSEAIPGKYQIDARGPV